LQLQRILRAASSYSTTRTIPATRTPEADADFCPLLKHTTYELIVPPHMYGTFNSLMASGQIVATPLSAFRY
jgi:hypothetical protein